MSPSLGHLKDDNETLLQVELDNPSQEKFTMGSSGSRLTYNKSSSGLSGGAIAGIVIACVVVLATVAIIAVLAKKGVFSGSKAISTNSNNNSTIINFRNN